METTTTVKPPPEEPEPDNQTLAQPAKPVSFANGFLKLHPRSHFPDAPRSGGAYRECLKNHAAAMGGHAVDGCGEFMPSPTSLLCSACGCHRNFHRRDPEFPRNNNFVINRPDPTSRDNSVINKRDATYIVKESRGHFLINGTGPMSPVEEARMEFQHHHRHHPLPPPRSPNSPSPPSPPPISSAYAPHMLLSLSNLNPSPNPYSDPGLRKRFRTKFTQHQKTKMHELAERLGWRMQRRDDDMINEFCNGIGVKKGVFKVWMHNNKNTHGTNGSNGVGINLDNAPGSDNYRNHRNNLRGDVSAHPVGTNGNGSSSSS